MKTNKKIITTAKNKERLLIELEKTLGIVTSACKICNLDRVTFYNYYNNDEEFKAKVDSINEQTIDFAENSLLKQIKAGDTTATIFYLKTKGRKRGYEDQRYIDLTTKGNEINITPTIKFVKFNEDEPT